MADVLFEITTDQLDTGLRGYPVGYCNTSHVDPQKGLFYAGIPIPTLADWEPEQVIYLLYYGKEGSAEEVKKFSQELKRRSTVSKEVIDHINKLPKQGHPMAIFNAAILVLGMFEGKDDYREDCLNLIAKIPEVAAAVINHHAGWGRGAPSDPSLGYIDNFTNMLNVPHANKSNLNEIFKLFNVLHYDHGGGNLSTFVGKAVASGLEDMYGSIASAMCALAGPLHGRANQECLEFVQKVLRDLGDNPNAATVEQYLRKLLANNEVIYGFGHAVLRVEDPRASVFYEVAKNKFPTHALTKITALLRSEGPKVLKENPKISDPYPNVDAMSGSLLSMAGFPYPEYYTILFGLSRVVGISIQIVVDRCEARGGKGTPIVRPKYLYKPRF